MNILVTGGAGYLGSTLVPLLLSKGYKVTVCDNFSYGQIPLLYDCSNKNLTIKRLDAFDLTPVDLQFFDAIIHLACITGAPACDKNPKLARSVNYELVRYILAHTHKEQKIIFPCTNSGYGIGEDNIHCDETTPLNPVSLYAKLKVDAEKLIINNSRGVSLRFATLFGLSPRMRLDLLVNDFVFRAKRDKFLVLFEPHFKRNYLHVKDAANVVLHTLEHYDDMLGEVYNFGLSDANLSKLELAEKIKEHIPNLAILIHEDLNHDPDKRNYIISNEKIKSTGWITQHSLDDGIKELIKGYEILGAYPYTNI